MASSAFTPNSSKKAPLNLPDGPVCVELRWSFPNYWDIVVDRYYSIATFEVIPGVKWTLMIRRRTDDEWDAIWVFLHEGLNTREEIFTRRIVTMTLHDVNDVHLMTETAKGASGSSPVSPSCFFVDGYLSEQYTDVVKFSCKLVLYPNEEVKWWPHSRDMEEWRRDAKVRQGNDLANYLLRSHPKSVQLRTTTDGASLSVNKALLCARSEVFASMFEHGTTEGLSDVVDIDDVGGDVVKTLVEFMIRPGEVDLDLSVLELMGLYYAADKYQVLDLRDMCACCLERKLTISSICEACDLADRHQDQVLQDACGRYVRRNVWSLKDERWLQESTLEWVKNALGPPTRVIDAGMQDPNYVFRDTKFYVSNILRTHLQEDSDENETYSQSNIF